MDIVERLRDPAVFVDRNEVANEIEKLRVEVKQWQLLYQRLADSRATRGSEVMSETAATDEPTGR